MPDRKSSWMKSQGAEEGSGTLRISLKNDGLHTERVLEDEGNYLKNDEHGIKEKSTFLKTSRQYSIPGLPGLGLEPFVVTTDRIPCRIDQLKEMLTHPGDIPPHQPSVWWILPALCWVLGLLLVKFLERAVRMGTAMQRLCWICEAPFAHHWLLFFLLLLPCFRHLFLGNPVWRNISGAIINNAQCSFAAVGLCF